MNRLVKTLALAAPLLSAALLSSGSADACGGCFHPPSTNTVVSGHRMALSISMKQTVLWDQIQYQGNPEEFSWVLPIKPGARIEVATSEWFETLESATSTIIQAPELNCGNQGQTFGCGSSSAGVGALESAGDGSGEPPVTVVHQETVGPYESVTLSSKDPSALTSWLESHGYVIPDDIQPVIGAYVSEGFDFVALRLTPGNGVNLMTPVRVITDGASPALPLRMVAAGTGATTSIVLYVISEGRWTTQNFPEGKINFDDVVWDGEVNDSNYAEIRLATMAQATGRTWIASYAEPDAFFSDPANSNSYYGGIGYQYFQQGLNESGTNWEEVNACTQKLDAASGVSGVVVDTCDPVTKECGTPAPGEVDARDLTCGELTDLSVALLGMHPKDVWVTRLEANLPRTALLQDLTLKASDSQDAVDRFHALDKAENYECPAAPIGPGSKRDAPPSGNGTAVMLAGLGAIATLLAARRVRSARALRA